MKIRRTDIAAWVGLVVPFSLAEIFCLLAASAFIAGYTIDWPKLMSNGVLMFFSSTLVASVTLDYWFGPVRLDRGVELAVWSFSLVVIAAATLTFGLLFDKPPQDIRFHTVVVAQTLVAVVSVMYAFLMKCVHYSK